MKYKVTIKTNVEAESQENAEQRAFYNLELGDYSMEVEEEWD